MNTKPLVSVLIPAYNHEKYVQEAIKSIIAQTYQNIELIVVDDGSKDSTWQKIQQLQAQCQKRFPRIHFETKENEGTCATLNRLINLSEGDYIVIIASDDIAASDLVEKEVSFLAQNDDYSLVVGDNGFMDSEGKICYWDKSRNIVYDKKQAKYLTFGQYLQQSRHIDFNSNNFGKYETLDVANYVPNGYMIRKSIFKKIGMFTPDAPLEDYWLMLQISKYSKMKYLDSVLFYYRWHSSNTAGNSDKMTFATNKTKEYEYNLLKNTNKNELPQNVIDYYENGRLYKRIGIPYIFEVRKYRRFNSKTLQILIFNKILKT